MEGLLQFDRDDCISNYINNVIGFCASHLNLILALLFVTIILYRSWRRAPIFLVDFECFRSPDSHRVPISSFIEHSLMREKDFGTLGAAEFERKVIIRSGIGNESYATLGMDFIPVDTSYKQSMEEVKLVLFSVTETLLNKHNISPKSIDIIITNCSVNCPTPSLAAMIINKFGFRSNVRSVHLSGMGCSAGLLSIGLAKDLLKIHKNSLALVLSTETICSNLYKGSVKSMLLANCLFQVGGAAILLSNRSCDRDVAKYELQHLVRTHLGAKDDAYTCVFQKADDVGNVGVSLSRRVVEVASEALRINMTTLGPLVLPYSEQIHYVLHFLWNYFHPWKATTKKAVYVPKFKKAFDHFCIHAGGKAVIEGIKGMLKLSESDVEASKMTLYRFGNTSSSSTWYSLCYHEAKGRIKKGDKVFQICFGSGFKCNSAVWKCVSKRPSYKNVPSAWSDKIDRFPVNIPEVIDY
ncbi:3-ketoacyl-CoA synthase 7-like [Silene latifolia]|uniref:3-ketoacyl-CoA synthase 7-like n=1 Tax=Silene latifolia TaxID=37657 RepID=UPI003D773028